MNMNDISTQLIYTTVPIYIQKQGRIASGTGFIFSIMEKDNMSIPLLITNYHVLEDVEIGCIELHNSEQDKPTNETIKVQFDKTVLTDNRLGNLDLVAIPLAGTFNDFNTKGIQIFYRTVDQNMIPSDEQIEEFSAMENITFIGYPSGLYDNINKLPILRQGITATPIWNKFQGKENFLIDAGVFPGSSGSPVFICNQGSYPTKGGITIGNRLLFVGVISQTMQIRDSSSNYLNLGAVINSKAILEELNKFIQRKKKAMHDNSTE